ncbi:LysM peptidoglycan-binding domain-containing protein [Salinibacterium sp. ZJ450]|uniref:muramidase family protein n=1 Tax=Salinibacterium sp. ZJ450 TaxID=2708338 RepID=UPI001CD44A3A|nr:LysM peptidoglycan-binding domain-containing protein [Salinibacterium sp. ZJ450]
MTQSFDSATPQDESPTNAHRVFAGLAPTQLPADRSREQVKRTRSLLNTVPIVLAGSVAVSMNMTAPVTEAEIQPRVDSVKTSASQLGKQIKQAIVSAGAAVKPASISTGAFATAAVAPSTYKVAAGDTVSSIAGRYGLSTASVLAMNGLGWKSVIFPGQVLKLASGGAVAAPVAATPAPSTSDRYTIKQGDTIGRIASSFGVSTQAVLSANGLSWSSIIYPGQTLAIPGQALAIQTVSSVQKTPAATAGSHVIRSGDTISSIAKKFGVSLSSLLRANNLSPSSIIYAGRSLVIPGATPAAVPSSPTQTGTTVTKLSEEMRTNARTIVRVGQDLGVPDAGIVIALATAMQESSLRNLNYGDRDSLGLFQQRPSAGWGTPEQIMNPTHSARLFYGGDSNPNFGVTRGLLEIPGWQSMTLTQAAQAVQISAFPDAYAKWETSARAWFADLR